MSAETPSRRRVQVGELWAWLSRADRSAIGGIGVAAFVIALSRHDTIQGIALGILAAWAAAIFVIDRRYSLIPDLLSLPLVPIGLAFSAIGRPDPLWQIAERSAAAAAIWGGLYVMRWVLSRQRGTSVMGGGDIKLIIAATAWLDLSSLPAFVLTAALSGLVEAWFTKSRALAFGCHLAPWLWMFAFFQ